MLRCPLLLISFLYSTVVHGVLVRDVHNQRCRKTDDLGRIPWFLPNSTFHNFGFPLTRTLCQVTDRQSSQFEALGCLREDGISYLYESVQELRSGSKSSTIIVDPPIRHGLHTASSGVYVVLAMFEILYELGYNPGVRHWSDAMNTMFPDHVAAAATAMSGQYQAYEQNKGVNPFANTTNHIFLQCELPFNVKTTVPVNTSPYTRTYKWIIGVHYGHRNSYHQWSDPTAHCAGANFHLGRARMCSTSGVIPCPQYQFHRKLSLEVTPETRKVSKKNVILVDVESKYEKPDIDVERLKADVMKLGGLDDLEVVMNRGRIKTEMPDLYKRVKMVIDCHNPGVEFINYESTLYDTMTLSCDMRATRNVFDFPVPSKYHINPHNWTEFVNLVHDSMINYEERIDDFKHFKRLSRATSQLAQAQVDIHYFSRDVVFRTHCASYTECRRVYPWAVAVWTLYPLAMIEVAADVQLFQELVDNDLIRVMLSELFTSKYFKIYNSVPGVAPVDMFPRTPCAYMVYMDASFIPFGRDFLNTHIAALVKDPRPIVYWQGDKIAIAVMHARPYVRAWFDANHNASYIESNFIIRAVDDTAVFSGLTKLFGAAEVMPKDYNKKLQAGPTFQQEHLDELLKKDPPLLSRPCVSSNRKGHYSGFTSSTNDVSTTADSSNSRRQASSSSKKQRTRPVSFIQSHHNHEQPFGAFSYRCAPPADLIIDALHVPMPHSSQSTGPTLWLTSSVAPVPFHTVFDKFNTKQIETIVQHLDPILQNSNMQMIVSFMSNEVMDALDQFNAAHYPNVISLRDMEFAQWGEKCAP